MGNSCVTLTRRNMLIARQSKKPTYQYVAPMPVASLAFPRQVAKATSKSPAMINKIQFNWVCLVGIVLIVMFFGIAVYYSKSIGLFIGPKRLLNNSFAFNSALKPLLCLSVVLWWLFFVLIGCQLWQRHTLLPFLVKNWLVQTANVYGFQGWLVLYLFQ